MKNDLIADFLKFLFTFLPQKIYKQVNLTPPFLGFRFKSKYFHKMEYNSLTSTKSTSGSKT